MYFRKTLYIIIFILSLLYSCNQEPLSPFKDPTTYTDSWGKQWTLYDDVLNTLGGDVLYFPSDGGQEIIYLDNRIDGTAYHGEKYFRFKWNGQPLYWEAQPPNNPTNKYEHSFAGFSLITASSPLYYDMVLPLDLTESHYIKITFYARGQLASGYNAKFEGPNGAIIDNVIPSSTWQKYEMDLKDLNNIKDFFKVTIEYDAADLGAPPGTGGYVDVDLISYEK